MITVCEIQVFKHLAKFWAQDTSNYTEFHIIKPSISPQCIQHTAVGKPHSFYKFSKTKANLSVTSKQISHDAEHLQ
jgi:hypothetical protein